MKAQIKEGPRNRNVGAKISEQTWIKLVDYGEKTKLGHCTLTTLAIIHFINKLQSIDIKLQEEINKDLSDFCDIWDRSYSNFVLRDLKKDLETAGEEDRIMIEIAIERGRLKTKKEVQNNTNE